MRRPHTQTFFIVSLLLLDACALILAFQAAYFIRFHSSIFLHFFPASKGVPPSALYYSSLFGLLPVWIIVFSYLGLYNAQLQSAYDEFIQVLKAVILCTLLTGMISFTIRNVEYSRLMIGLWALLGFLLAYALREIDKKLFQTLSARSRVPQKVVVIGRGKVVDAIKQMSHRQPFVQVQFMSPSVPVEQLAEYVKANSISEVLLVQSSVTSPFILEAAKVCERGSIDCRVIPDLLEMRRGQIIFDGFCGLPTFHLKPLSLYGSNYWMKRSFDLAASFVISLVIFIPCLIISLWIKMDSPGPVFYTQERVGLRGKKFKLFKFRTMNSDADMHIERLKHLSDRAGPVFKMKDDPRITRAGKFLRKYSLDEFPQIINVFLGDMSLVGPRPQVLWEAEHYDDTAKKRLRVMPGITGLWQVSGRAALSYEEMINLDIYYLENWSLGLDLKIMLRTLPAIFAKEGAY
jgi:exopolysaccharide biosynthesis polyprenyl glycosylphosphotransferase